ncbi:MAG: DUF4434 domain-containing protein [bacterium]|nr:DUF4434 domain-containing protein [bacterium]
MQITGTFIDEVTHDIPSQNWGPEQWTADFEVMRRIGIDTVIVIRAGYREQAIFDSAALAKHRSMLPVRENLARLFLDLAAGNGMKLYWGLYDPGDWAENAERALLVNRAVMNEVGDGFAGRPAFAGWYLTFELSRHEPAQVDLIAAAGRLARSLTPDLPTLISPYIAGPKADGNAGAVSQVQHEREWGGILKQIAECVDVVAFQDGHVNYVDLPEYLAVNARIVHEAGLACWSNVETFDRDMPIKFPPIDWRRLEFKLDAARTAAVDKIITFEFSHFLSPHSVHPAARNLFQRYCRRFGLEQVADEHRRNGSE